MGIVEAARADVRTLELADVFGGTLDPSPVFDMPVDLAGVFGGYAAMDERRAITVMVEIA